MNNPPSHLRSLLYSLRRDRLFKLVCLSMVAIAQSHAMQEVNELGELLLAAARTDDHKQMEQLLEAGAPADYTNKYGNNPLLTTASDGHLNCLQALINAQAQVNYQNSEGVTALILAATRGNLDCVQALIAAKADVNHESIIRGTALIYANELSCIQALLAAGARVNHVDKNGDTALVRAERSGQLEACELFINAMLWVPNQRRKAQMVTILGIAKFRKSLCLKRLDGYLHNKFKAVLRTLVYEDNKKNFAGSIAYK